MSSPQEHSARKTELQKRGRLLLMVFFWILAAIVCLNVGALASRNALSDLWTQLAFFACMLGVYLLLWTGQRWARLFGVMAFLFWAIVFLRPVFVSGPYLAPIVHLGFGGLLLLLTLALIFSDSVALFLDSKRPRDGRAFNGLEVAPAINRLRQDYLGGPRVGLKGARLRRILLSMARRTISGLAFFRRPESLGTGNHERRNQPG
jgi:hypothetical protein